MTELGLISVSLRNQHNLSKLPSFNMKAGSATIRASHNARRRPSMDINPEVTLIYLDICCFNRPFDDQSQLLVRLQTEAKLDIQQSVREGKLALVWSAVLDLENTANPDIERSKVINGWKPLAIIDIEPTPQVESLAEEFSSMGVKPMDALHAASAIVAGATYLITTDKQLLKKTVVEPRICVIDPVDFIKTQQEKLHEN